jgi:hypothetical protein
MPNPTITPEIQAVSDAWINHASPDQLQELLQCSTVAQALTRISLYRTRYGAKLFPYRKRAIAQGGYSNAKVKMLSDLWISGCTAKQFAKKAGLAHESSMYGTVKHLRNKHGADLFPRRDNR